jgi:hypothetical protein
MHAGELTLMGITSVGPSEIKNELTICKVRAQVRWNVPEELQELFRVKEIVGLHLPKGLEPGQSGEAVCVFIRQGWFWKLNSAESSWGGKWNLPLQARTWMDLVI